MLYSLLLVVVRTCEGSKKSKHYRCKFKFNPDPHIAPGTKFIEPKGGMHRARHQGLLVVP